MKQFESNLGWKVYQKQNLLGEVGSEHVETNAKGRVMRLSEDTARTVSYFFEGKGLDRWCGWEEKKAVILQELPLLRMYLDKEQELEALAVAVERELEAYIDKLEEGK